MSKLTFPLWIYVNEHARRSDGYPYYFLQRGGLPTPLPMSLPVYTAEEKARVISPGPPFKLMPVDEHVFYEAIRSCPEIAQVILDMGTPDAVVIKTIALLSH